MSTFAMPACLARALPGALTVFIAALFIPTTAAAHSSPCDLTGQWQKTYDFSANGKIDGRLKVNELQFQGQGAQRVGRYIGATASNTSTFTAECHRRGRRGHAAQVTIHQKGGRYSATIEGIREGDVIRGTWRDNSGNRGDIVLQPYFTPRCDLSGPWQKSYDFHEDGTISGRTKVNAFRFAAEGSSFVGRYIGAAAGHRSVFTTTCVDGSDSAQVRIEQNHAAYSATIEGTRRGDVIRGVWHDNSGNRGDIVIEPQRDR